MGTSTSHTSPNRPTWNSMRRLLRDETVPLDRVMNEVWSVALRDGDAPILDQLGSSVVYELGRISVEAQSPGEAARLATRAIARSKASSVVVELAKRALLGSVQKGENRIQAFAQGVFAEVAGYITARDLSGLIGSPKFKDASSSISFKADLRSITTTVVTKFQPNLDTPEAWNGFVRKVANALSGGRV